MYLIVKVLLMSALIYEGQSFEFKDAGTAGVHFGTETGGIQNLDMDENTEAETRIILIEGASAKPSIDITNGDKDIFDYRLQEEAGVYVFILKNEIDYEQLILKQLLVTVGDAGTTKMFSLKINNVIDENPTITSTFSSCEMPENTDVTVDNTPCLYKIYDADGFLKDMQFPITGDAGENDIFDFQYKETPKDESQESDLYLVLKTGKQLDFETSSLYRFILTAKDGANLPTQPTAEISVMVNVKDLPDQVPKWEQYPTITSVEEHKEEKFTVKARDGDRDINNEINYEVSGQSVTVNKQTGEVTLAGIERDGPDGHDTVTITISAYEVPDPTSRISQDFTIVVQDKDDNKPVIAIYDDDNKEEIKINIDENYSDQLPVKININDIDLGDNAMYDVELIDDDGKDYTSAFQIIPNTGYQSLDFILSVKDSSKLNYEDPMWQTITFTLQAVEKIDNNQKNVVPVTITLNDLNDEPPIFDQNGVYSCEVSEDVKANEGVCQVSATDADDGDVVDYNLVGSWANSYLQIDSSGKITTKSDNVFDYEKQTEVLVQVQATDQATPSHIATADITFKVLDVNDEPPTIKVKAPGSISENQPDGTNIDIEVTAEDPDLGASLEFSIIWEESYATKRSVKISDDVFTEYHCIQVITKVDGSDNRKATAQLQILETVKDNTPDYEKFDTLYLSLQVEDKNTEVGARTASTILVITIINENDNAPVFDESTLEAVVIENSSKDLTISTVIATDEDGNSILYSLTAVDDTTQTWVVIDENTGVLKVNDDKIDCDTPQRADIKYTVTATDSKFPKEAQLVIKIIDQNDNKPIMKDPTLQVKEKSKGTKIYDFDATDADRDEQFRKVTYRFEAGGTTQNFAINEEQTALFVKDDANLDRDFGAPSYQFIIICEDNPSNLGTVNTLRVTFVINLEDINDQIPMITTTELPSITENDKKGTSYENIIQAEDADSEGPFSQIDFKLTKIEKFADPQHTTVHTHTVSEDLFAVYTDSTQSKKATLTVNDDLKGQYGYYVLTIETNDFDVDSKPQNVFENKVNLAVEKFNFETPSFNFPIDGTTYILSTNQELDATLIMYNQVDRLDNIAATDNQGEKYDIKFTVKPVDESSNIFQVKATSKSKGELQLKSKEYEANKNYEVEITADINSNGNPITDERPHTATIKATFIFFDINSSPIFDTTQISINFEEEDTGMTYSIDPAHYLVTDISPPIYYLLDHTQEDASFFEVNKNTGLITVIQKLDYETKQTYYIEIQASNSANGASQPDEKSILEVTINVIDINDNIPAFDQLDYYGGIKTTYPLDTSVVNLIASDLDVNDKLQYSIGQITTTDSSLADITVPFKISPTANGAEIKLNFQVQTNMKGNFAFNVMVQDPDETHTNTAAVKIYVVSDDNVINFKFENELETVQKEVAYIKTVLDAELQGYASTIQIPVPDTTDSGIPLTNQTIVPVYFIDTSTNQPVNKDEIQATIIDPKVFARLRSKLLEKSLVLSSFSNVNGNVTDNSEDILRAWLIGVSVGLGALCIILLLAFILKTRSLSQRINNLSSTKFGSQESDLNRQGIAAPTTNRHAIEGSNPVYNTNDETPEIDQVSIRSGDSELIGVEELPDFQDQKNLNSYF